MNKNKKQIIIMSIIAITFLILFIVWGLTAKNYRFNLSLRIPKVLGILIAGGTISVASILFQTITNNRIITPSIIGLDSLYSLVQTIVVFIFGSTSVFMVNKTVNFLTSGTLMVLLAMVLFKVVLKKSKNNITKILREVENLKINNFYQKYKSANKKNYPENESFYSISNLKK